jgi:copper homeostasis protein
LKIKPIDIEVCAFSLEACHLAQKAGANRIELCGGQFEGGTTPSAGLIISVKKEINLDIFVMIRPRGGDFLYSEMELNVMKSDIELAKKLGVEGIVLGVLKKNGEVDIPKTTELVQLAYPMKVTFHRAIDVTPNAEEALEMIIQSGCIRVLTSGQQNRAIDGINTIEQLVKNAKNHIDIMAGASVSAENALNFIEKGVHALHLSGKAIRQSQMEYRKANVSMSDIAGIDEFEQFYTDFTKVKSVVEIAKKYRYE